MYVSPGANTIICCTHLLHHYEPVAAVDQPDETGTYYTSEDEESRLHIWVWLIAVS